MTLPAPPAATAPADALTPPAKTPSSKKGTRRGKAALLAPTEAAPPPAPVASLAHLMETVSAYLTPDELKRVREAYRFSDEAHLGQFRSSGEPYVSHPIAVAEICAAWKLDDQALMAALLHDVMEDSGITKQELVERFGAPVAQLVDGLSKLDKIEFQSRAEAQAENFRKMLLAMAQDVRVILIKLADRLHNMRTLGAVSAEKRRRIAHETLDVYAPIAHRLGLNPIYRELQDLSFSHLYPYRYRVLSKAVLSARGNRRDFVSKVLETLQKELAKVGIQAEIFGREKTLYGIYRKMLAKNLSFSQVLDIYGFRIVVDTLSNCYLALGVIHNLYKPVPGKFKDYIAIPKLNGYRSLHTTLVGPYGTPVEIQIRANDMHRVAEAGVAAHWLYKSSDTSLNELQQHTHQWLQSLLDIQNQTGDSAEFLEHVKVDLFPDEVYVFTPRAEIMALPRGATPVDFAYNVHTDIGNHCVAAKINNATAPIRTELKNGDIVEIITAPYAKPNPSWLTFVRTGKARSEIRHFLKTMRFDESVELGTQLLRQAMINLQMKQEQLSPEAWERMLKENNNVRQQDILAEIGLGKRLALVVARRLLMFSESDKNAESSTDVHTDSSIAPLVIHGTEGIAIQLSPCCCPIPGDPIIGHLPTGQGLAVHTDDCPQVQRNRQRDPDRWIDLQWAPDLRKLFTTRVDMTAHNERGVLAKIAAEIGEAGSNIVSVATEEDTGSDQSLSILHFKLQVHDRQHLASIFRAVHRMKAVSRVVRPKG
ncbi:MAG: bifunctional (p)ppGpp synthetase/guanosine-3',5'-bis(diphosphate) 3'-pyrophosphohydrolase [Burkholderiaceae bacterium]|nr:MAG: bifunctional (p)ppGpp synthetase/guanosine-3',5'-bis(diphosphate) 3'-pyrophosphohydrolase [Burkholderiaceae bacterium]